MALTKNTRGTGTHGTGATSLAVVPASNLTAGALAVLVVAYDNTGTSGADPYASISDTPGNTWTPQRDVLNDPGAAAAGSVLRFFTTNQAVGTLTTAHTITVSFGSVSVVAKCWALHEWTGSVGVPFVKSTGAGETSASASPTITSSSIHNATAIVAAMAHEYGQAATDDSDTSSGSWAAGEKGNVGSTTSGMSLCCQTKIVTAAGTQTFNPTWANSSDNSEGWIQIAEALTSTPGVVALTTTKYAPTVSAPRLCTPPTLALTATRYAPTVSAPRLVTVGAGPAMVVVNAGGGGAPGLYAIIGWRPTPTTKVLTLTTFAPTVTALNPQTATPVTASLTLSPFAPTAQVPRLCTPVAVANALATFAPGVFAPRLCTPTTLAAGLATFAPVVRLPKLATPTTAALAITAYAPTVEVAATNQTATPITASLTLAAFAPSVSLPRTATPATRGVAVTLYAPSVVVATNLVVVVGAASMATSSYAPRVRWEPLAFRLEVGDDVSCSNCEVGSSVTVRQEVTP